MRAKLKKVEQTDEQIMAELLTYFERQERKNIKVSRGKFIRTFKRGSKAEILQMIEKPFDWDTSSDLTKFKVGQIVEVSFEYASGDCLIVGESYFELHIPTSFLKSIN
jgi:hypothetical protein